MVDNVRKERLKDLLLDNYNDIYLKWYTHIEEIISLDDNILENKYDIIYKYYLAHMNSNLKSNDYETFLNSIVITSYITNQDLFNTDYKGYISKLKPSKRKNNEKVMTLFTSGYNAIEDNEDMIKLFRYNSTDTIIYNKEIIKNTEYPDYFDNDMINLIYDTGIAPHTDFINRIKKGYYDYNSNDEEYSIWINLAKQNLGEYIFKEGFEQKIMFLEIPQLGAISYKLKDQNLPRSQTFAQGYTLLDVYITQATPIPIIIQNLTRVHNINVYSQEELKTTDDYYDKLDTYQKDINVLAIAIPNLESIFKNKKYPDFKQMASGLPYYTKSIIYDLFNTLAKGFELVYLTAPRDKPIIINSRKIQSKYGHKLIGALHFIAQEYINQKYNTNIKVTLWGYNQQKVTELINKIISYKLPVKEYLDKIHYKFKYPKLPKKKKSQLKKATDRKTRRRRQH